MFAVRSARRSWPRRQGRGGVTHKTCDKCSRPLIHCELCEEWYCPLCNRYMPCAKNPRHVPCDCHDPGCAGHLGVSDCHRAGRFPLRRVDMGDAHATMLFCEACLDDAMPSGLFAVDDEEER